MVVDLNNTEETKFDSESVSKTIYELNIWNLNLTNKILLIMNNINV